MPLTYPTTTLTGGITLLDYNSQTAPMDFNLKAATAALADTALKAIATAYADGVGGASINRLRVTQAVEPVEDDAAGVVNPVPVFGNQGEYVARFVFNTDVGGTCSIDIPAPLEAVLDANDKKRINTGHAKVAALIALLIAEVNAPNGAALVSLKEAFIKHKESKIG